jgi:hypothetical protein
MASLLSLKRPCFSLDHKFAISRRHCSKPQQPSRHTLGPSTAFPILIEATVDAATAVTTGFEARIDPNIAVAAAAAAMPPIVYWIQVVLREQGRIKAAEEKETAREELKKKLFGKKR